MVPAPAALVGRDLGGCAVAERTGLTIVGVQQNGVVVTNPPGSTSLQKGTELIMLGSNEQQAGVRQGFRVRGEAIDAAQVDFLRAMTASTSAGAAGPSGVGGALDSHWHV